jgi:membrane-associated phospholipid phosphatase
VNIAPDDAALRWRTYGRWAGLNLLVFGVLYPLVNWFTGARASTFGLYLDGERTIPFLPVWIWAYLSINLLFMLPPLFMRASDMPLLGKRMLVATLSGCLIFLLLPARLGFERVVPGDGLYRAVFGGLFQADGPHNLVPSLHVTYASLCILSFQAAAPEWRTRAAWGLWLVTIMASTVLVHQHHLLDVVSGLGLAAVIRVWIPERKQT